MALLPHPRGGLLILGATLLGLVATAAEAADVRATIGLDPQRRAGADGTGNVLLFAPNPVQLGSSISHWDTSAFPKLLLEPSVSSGLPGGQLDLTTALLRDLGWTTAGGAVIDLNFTDPPDRGFNHPSLGGQRRGAFRAAADRLQQAISSSVRIVVDVGFESLTCSGGSAVLAQASPRFAFPRGNTWFPGPLAEALAGRDLSGQGPDPNAPDMTVTFNERIDDQCLAPNSTFDYSPDGNASSPRISFVNVALHEMAHGLGFASLVNLSTGALFMGMPDIYSRQVLDTTLNRHWSEMAPSEIVASSVNGPHVVWDGAATRSAAASFLRLGAPSARVAEPAAIAGSYIAATANFGPELAIAGVTGNVAIVRDASGSPELGCAPASNPGELEGRIALVARGDCTFVTKVRNAQQAGAIGVIVTNNVQGLLTMGGSDASIRIPSILVSQATGDLLRRTLLNGPGAPPNPPDPPGPPPDDPDREDPSICIPSDTAMCLSDGRFRVEAVWASEDGKDGQAQTVSLTPDTGYLWFIRESNVEVVVKVLNACGLEGFESFWVFAGGLTNLEVNLKIVDTETGRIRRYDNAQGVPFVPIQDLQAFDECP